MSKTMEDEVFENAPIVLAMIQFRYDKLEGFNSDKIVELSNQIKDEFPICQVTGIDSIKIDPTAETKFSLDKREVNGVRLTNDKKTKVVGIGINRFTLELHGDYPGWEVFSAETKKLWDFFSPNLQDFNLTGLSLRYLNRIDLPIDTSDLKKYFTTYIHSERDYAIADFQFKYTTAKDNNITHIAHSLETAIENKIPYFFDIDVIHLGQMENKEEIIWSLFQKLREQKNSLFNDGITEETKKLIR